MEKPVVSIVVPAYNASRYLKKNVESLLQQTMTEFELIYVDDGSKDDTLKVLREYQKKDDRIQIISQDNHGAAHARNTGMQAASGKYVLILDADDFFDTKMLEKTTAEAEKNRLDILIFDCYMYNEQTEEITRGDMAVAYSLLPEKEVFSAEDVPDTIFQTTGTIVWNKLYRRDFLREHDIRFREDIRVIDDYYMEIISLAEAQRIGVLPERLLYYRWNNPESQIGGHESDLPDTECKACEAVYGALIERGKLAAIEGSYIKQAYKACVRSLIRTPRIRFEEIYNKIKYEWLSRLGILDKPETYFYDTYQYEMCKNIQKLNAAEFLLWQIEQTPVVQWGYLFPKEVAVSRKKLVIYGAGNVGKDYYAQAVVSDTCEVTAWVDRRYQELQNIGYPVVSPEKLKNMEYDGILFAMEDEGLAYKIMEELARQGCDRNKMLWIKPRYNLLAGKY